MSELKCERLVERGVPKGRAVSKRFLKESAEKQAARDLLRIREACTPRRDGLGVDCVLWRIASWIANCAFVGVTGDLRPDLFRHLTGSCDAGNQRYNAAPA
jgi:hypothetical protein